jgi:hypothetical protein
MMRDSLTSTRGSTNSRTGPLAGKNSIELGLVKQGNALLSFLLVEAAQVTVRSQPDWPEQVLLFRDVTRAEDRESSDGAIAGGQS